MITANQITSLLPCKKMCLVNPEAPIDSLLTDSRRVGEVSRALFFAIPTKRNSGCRYVADLYQRGTRNFVVPVNMTEEQESEMQMLEEANFWYVDDVIEALQRLATWNRNRFTIPVVGITGSNGKTIIKDWIVQLLGEDRSVVASPKSFNSQIGVPLSVWQMRPTDQIAVFEAGISAVGEMDHLREVIKPTIGIFSNIGQAHELNFESRSQKLAEKLKFFTQCNAIIYCADHKDIASAIQENSDLSHLQQYPWGTGTDNAVQLVSVAVGCESTKLSISCRGRQTQVEIPFVDKASVENVMHCIALMCYLGYEGDVIAHRCSKLTPVAMRLEMNEGINDCQLVNDSYSLDINSLTIALDYVQRERQHTNKTLIMSDFQQSALPERDLYSQVFSLIQAHGITKFIGVGESLCRNQSLFSSLETYFYHSTQEFIRQHKFDTFRNETLLLKGARVFHFEDVAKMLQRKSHQTIMEVNLDALIRNLNYYRSRIKPTTKLMAMVKASSYGAGTVEVANVLQYNHVDYMTVAYADEGVELRQHGIVVPVMIMNPEEESFHDIIKYRLEPDIYSFRIFDSFSETASLLKEPGQKIPVHLELDTGMHRLGFSGDDIPELIQRFSSPDCVLEIKSIFSHFACSEDPEMDDFTRLQIARFTEWSQAIKAGLGRPDILCSILNSSGITRFPEAQMDMVRLGIGLYGISPEPEVQEHLELVSRLKTRISQVKRVPQGDSVGYNRRWIAKRDSKIAIISIGYADGLNRHLGYENGKVQVNGALVPIIGSICMDMCFLDVTDVDCREGDEVTIFGDAKLLSQIADAAGTITYEMLTSVSQRVKRIYYQE